MLKNAALALALVVLTAAPASAFCFQDQYGFQYTFSLDKGNGLVLGSATSDPNCDTAAYHVFGSFMKVAGNYEYELTAVNPLGEGDSVCVHSYKIKGQWPAGDWYFPLPFPAYPEDRSFTWKGCSALRPPPGPALLSGGGQLK